jgi:nitroreductase
LAELAVPGGQRYLAQLAHGESPWSPLSPCGVAPQNISAIDASAFAAPIRDARVVLVLCLDLSVTAALDQELDRVGVVAGASVYPFAWNVLLAARNEGFGGVLTTAIVAREPAVKDLLNIPDHFAVAAALPLGKPVRQPNRLTRKSIAEIATWDRFDGPPM